MDRHPGRSGGAGRRPFWGLAFACFLLFAAFAHPAPATKPTLGPPRGSHPELGVRFLEPKPGATLSEMASIAVDLGGDPQKFELGFEGQQVFEAFSTTLDLSTFEIPNGAHTLLARATYASGEKREARVQVTVYNPHHRLMSYNPTYSRPANGRDVILELTYNESNLNLEADFGGLDSGFRRSKVRVEKKPGGVYRVTYPISAKNSTPPGRRTVKVRAKNAQGEVATSTIELELNRLPLIPVVVASCVFSPGQDYPQLIDRFDEPDPPVRTSPKASAMAPSQVTLQGLPDLAAGGSTMLMLRWKGPSAPPPSGDRSRIVIRADQYSGYYQCWVPKGQTSAMLLLALPGPGKYGSNLNEGEPLPSSVDLQVAVDTVQLASGWVRHRLTVRPEGWQRPRTPEEERLRQEKIKRAAERKGSSP